jgi:hypothetical protein
MAHALGGSPRLHTLDLSCARARRRCAPWRRWPARPLAARPALTHSSSAHRDLSGTCGVFRNLLIRCNELGKVVDELVRSAWTSEKSRDAADLRV